MSLHIDVNGPGSPIPFALPLLSFRYDLKVERFDLALSHFLQTLIARSIRELLRDRETCDASDQWRSSRSKPEGFLCDPSLFSPINRLQLSLQLSYHFWNGCYISHFFIENSSALTSYGDFCMFGVVAESTNDSCRDGT